MLVLGLRPRTVFVLLVDDKRVVDLVGTFEDAAEAGIDTATSGLVERTSKAQGVA